MTNTTPSEGKWNKYLEIPQGADKEFYFSKICKIQNISREEAEGKYKEFSYFLLDLLIK